YACILRWVSSARHRSGSNPLYIPFDATVGWFVYARQEGRARMTRRAPDSGRWTRHEVTADEAGRTVQEILTGPLRVSRRMIQRLTRSGGIRLDRRPTHLQRRVRTGEEVAARISMAEEP